MKRGRITLGKTDESPVELPLSVLTKHVACLGNTGSGKTVLTKVFIEECALQGVPSIVVDSQGDLASLGIIGTGKEVQKQDLENKQKRFQYNVEVVTYTPTSGKGVPLCINPLASIASDIEEETAIGILSMRAEGLTSLLGYKTGTHAAKAATSALYIALEHVYHKNIKVQKIQDIIDLLASSTLNNHFKGLITKNQLDTLIRNLKYLLIGGKKLLFSFGQPLDIDTLLGKGSKKTRISVIYLNTLESQQEKNFFLAMLTESLYQWMQKNPRSVLQALYVIDEIAPYLPAGMQQTVVKPALRLLYKQARKYGVGCILSTQNPGDVDYKAFAQFGTVAIGRLTTKQDRAKVRDLVHRDDLLKRLPNLRPGKFALVSPDTHDDATVFSVRYLLTEHQTLTENHLPKVFPKKKPYHAAQAISSSSFRGMCPQISEQEARNVLQKERKKRFVVLGSYVEEVNDISLQYHPYYLVTIKYAQSTWLRRKPTIRHATICLDAVSGQFGRLTEKGFSACSTPLESFIGLGEDPLRLFLHVQGSKGNPRTGDLRQEFGNQILRHMKTLHNAKLITFQRTEDDKVLVPLTKITYPKSLNALHTHVPPITKVEGSGKKQPVFDAHLIASLLRGLYDGVEVLETQTVYLPEFSGTLKTNDSTRDLRVCALSGQLKEK